MTCPTSPGVSRYRLHLLLIGGVGDPNGDGTHRPNTWRTAANVKVIILPCWVVGNEICVCLRTIQNDSHTRWCILLTYCHTDCADKRADGNEQSGDPRYEFRYLTHLP